MNNISHRIGIKADISRVFHALTTNQGLSQWWTRHTIGDASQGSILTFNFPDHGPSFKVVELIANKRVHWQHHGDMPEQWQGTSVIFELTQDEQQTWLHFYHKNWQQRCSFMSHCSMKWAIFMLSLKQFIETGCGRPFPDDIQIDHND
ncbi:SRPBCC family protein [Thalassotalea sp. ND16A]|uniref:SRPBCC family protein n=1 Tax=Thalassotalea sp. ND16A TaxID=1535422 RepID=UPI00051A3250|nr:SRPBCC domain-containing protein [Thalassotalea sp. ND16A]KGJ97999.1 hypothetical protein ND16A_0804 [Thalassotalea sp. ND16A]